MAVDARRRERTWPFALIVLLVIGYAAWLLQGHAAQGRALVGREDAAREALLVLRGAQEAHHGARGTYGTWSELRASGNLPAAWEITQEAEDPHVVVAGYRLDVLLPWRLEAGQLVRISRPMRNPPDPELRARHMTLVARPRAAGEDGFRTYATDESGVMWVNEGVSDESTAARNLLPDAHLSTSRLADTSGRVWHRLDTLVPFGESRPAGAVVERDDE